MVDCRINAGDTSLGFASSRCCMTVCFLDFGILTCLLNMSASTRGVRQAIDSCGPDFDNLCYHGGRELLENRHWVVEVASNCRFRYRPGRLTAAGVEQNRDCSAQHSSGDWLDGCKSLTCRLR